MLGHCQNLAVNAPLCRGSPASPDSDCIGGHESGFSVRIRLFEPVGQDGYWSRQAKGHPWAEMGSWDWEVTRQSWGDASGNRLWDRYGIAMGSLWDRCLVDSGLTHEIDQL